MAARFSERSGRLRLGAVGRRRGGSPSRGAEEWLRSVLDQARRGTLPGMVRTGATFADAAAEYLRYIEHDRGRKPSTVRGYRSAIEAHLLPVFGSKAVESVTTSDIERWIATVDRSPRTRKQADRVAARDLRAGSKGVRPAAEPGGRGREAPPAAERRHRGVLPRGVCCRCGPRFLAGCGDLPDRRVHRAAPRGADRAALARRRFRRFSDPGAAISKPRGSAAGASGPEGSCGHAFGWAALVALPARA